MRCVLNLSIAAPLLTADCRRRWYNHLNPDIRKGPWTDDEEEQLLRAHAYAAVRRVLGWHSVLTMHMPLSS
jgi:hypothetical protein